MLAAPLFAVNVAPATPLVGEMDGCVVNTGAGVPYSGAVNAVSGCALRPASYRIRLRAMGASAITP
ncbi:hypothetical protein Sbs19_29490 [Sphingobium sp. BS19]|nr:hypothetical protein Sbs19_29490 [Sphingobium sp. BS19]